LFITKIIQQFKPETAVAYFKGGGQINTTFKGNKDFEKTKKYA
jgi:hypothetical protein